MTANRRQLLTGAAAALAFGGLLRRAAAQADPGAYRSEIPGYGPLRADPAGLFDLPEGFSYTVVSSANDPLDDGFVTPGKFDGMGCFPLDAERVVLVRNHEVKPRDLEISAFGAGRALASKAPAERIYDLDDEGLPFGGGTTSLVYNLKTRRREAHHLSLAGTSTNCAGGITPWGSWLSCEETTQSKGQEAGKDHGWVFEVPSRAKGLVEPRPIVGMGRFRHEAAAIDPRTGVVYLTEDMSDGFGLFYRYLPNRPGDLHAGGRLQALALPEGRDADPRNWTGTYWRQGDWRPVKWVDLAGVDNPYEDLRHRGHAAGAAWFASGEGIFFGKGELYFACTSGGPAGGGQIMRYVPGPREGHGDEAGESGRLQLFVEPMDGQLMEMCDNIAVAPWGHLFACEDRVGDSINFLRAVTPQGRIYTVGRNAQASDGDEARNSELAGVCFSPDASTVFVNIYAPGVTLAITGPWNAIKG